MNHNKKMHSLVVVFIKRVSCSFLLQLPDLVHRLNIALLKQDRLQMVQGSLDLLAVRSSQGLFVHF